MKFKIVWLEISEETGEDLKKFMDSLPNPKITGSYGGVVTEIECVDTFEAENIEEAKKKIEADYYDVGVFTVINTITGDKAFTEEDC